jgi:hypothetical protein
MLFSRKEVRTEERKEERNEKAEPVFDSDLRCQNLTFMGALNCFLTILPFVKFTFYIAVLLPFSSF